MDTYDLLMEFSKFALERSKIYDEGEVNYAYAFGWFTSDIIQILDEVKLTDEQLKMMKDILDKRKN